MTLGLTGPGPVLVLIIFRGQSCLSVLTIDSYDLTVVDQFLEVQFKTGSAIEIITQNAPRRCPHSIWTLRRLYPKAFFLVVSLVSVLADLGLAVVAFPPTTRN